MDNMDDSENNAKISDSAYSNSCSNSQSRRSSKSTHSGSNSSGSSGYGGKPSTSGYSSNNQALENRTKEKESKKKKQSQSETLSGEARKEIESLPEPAPIFESPQEDTNDGVQLPSQALVAPEKIPDSMDIATPEDDIMKEDPAIFGSADLSPANVSTNYVTSYPPTTCSAILMKACDSWGKVKWKGSPLFLQLFPIVPHQEVGFSCVISLHDGVVMYTTPSLSTTLGFPDDMWIGRSFIDFVHPRDRNAFASQITNGLAVPKNLNGTLKEVQPLEISVSPMVCRIRRYKDLASAFAVKKSVIIYMPFLIKFSFKNVNGEDGNVTYLVIQAAPFFSAFKIPNECVPKPVPFIIRHAANGKLEYLDPESVPYLGFLPQDVAEMDALHLYHPCDLLYLRHVYETIVKEGGSPRSKPYRMLAQNGDYVVLETEWSSFVNPWTKKLEFVIGKHYVITGPVNPDVFQSPEPNKEWKITEEEYLNAQSLREIILKMLSQALTKPAEVAKQQMNKRCHDLATFMESLLEDQPKTDEEIRLEIQEPEHSYCERDSVMLGGISPHHDYNDSKSSTETPVSYNQLNYNDTLQRYFDSHLPYSNRSRLTVTGENIMTNEQIFNARRDRTSSSAGTGVSGESSPALIRGVSPLVPMGDYYPVRLTESRLSRHNEEMEKELVKMHRENRVSSKGEKEKNSNENRQKKKEHLARCNASFQPTSAGVNVSKVPQSQGVKRNSKQFESEPGVGKHHCTTSRQARRRLVTPPAPMRLPPAAPSAPPPLVWPSNPVNNMNGFICGVGIPQQMSMMSPMATMPGIFPMHYVPPPAQQTPVSTTAGNVMPGSSSVGQYQASGMQCMMYGQAMYGAPFMYSSIGPQLPYPSQQSYVPHGVQYINNPSPINPLGLASSNYREACKAGLPPKPANDRAGNARSLQRDLKKRAVARALGFTAVHGRRMSNSSANVSHRSTDVVLNQHRREQSAKASRLENSDDTIDRTDEESSYSSFYSSFFKTESGSAEESSDSKKQDAKHEGIKRPGIGFLQDSAACETKQVPRRKMQPPWMDQVCVSSELIYKYQVYTKSVEEVLASDLQKLKTFEQPSLVNQQLSQLYLDLQLEGVTARLTLEEGITSSSSSGEETVERTAGANLEPRRRKEYSKLVMIYEENAPLPPPDRPSASAAF